MKIKRLIISEYKNVKNLNLKFKTPLISLLVGRNGLGKSNLIEILALIFRDLDLLENEDDFKEWAYSSDHFEYFIEYSCLDSEMRILSREGKFKVFRRQSGSSSVFTELAFQEFKSRKKEEFLPKYVIGYYSGENKRIKGIMRAYEEIVWAELKDNKGLDKSMRRLFFGENYHAQIILLTLLLYKGQNQDADFQTKSNELIEKYCSFKDLEEISFSINQPKWFSRNRKGQAPFSIENLDENLLDEERKINPFWMAKGKADKIITYFYNKAETHNGYYDEDEKIEKLELRSIDKVDAAARVFGEFGHPMNFFDALESLFQIESLGPNSINLKVVSKNGDVIFDFSQLSEGEQQLITVLGLILIAGREDCLFLLDEPDTHLNPIWQREYVKLLTDFNLRDDNSHIIVATHSPLIVQAADDQTDIFLYKTNDQGDIVVDSNDLKIHNWRIDQVLASEYFQFENTRPLKLDAFMKDREELLSKPVLTEEDIQKIKSYEEAEDLLPSGETLDDFKAMHLIHITANRISQNDQNQ